MSANDESAEWEWSDGRPLPTVVYIDSAMSQHMGDVFLRLDQEGSEPLGIVVTDAAWDDIDTAARAAIQHRRDLTNEGWT